MNANIHPVPTMIIVHVESEYMNMCKCDEV